MSTYMSTPFQYRPLTKSGEIRVFTLDPSPNREAVLKGSFQHIVLLTQYFTDHYVALSYVWGDSTTTDTILVDGHKIGIAANLSAALRDIRNRTRVLRIWIDALCIDQRNIPERNRQVALMGDIYSTASSTIIYLGPLSPDTQLIFQRLRGGMFRSFDNASSINLTPIRQQDLESNGPSKEVLDLAAASSQLLARPWFRRAWTFQELVLSRDPWFQCGSRHVRWMDLCNLLLPLLREYQSGMEVDLVRMKEVHDAVHARSDTDRGTLSLWRILEIRGRAQATDPRDLIYANMGLHLDRQEVGEFVQIDYNKTARETFIEVGLYAMKHVGFNRALSNISVSPLRSILPSWVPDWGFDAKLESIDGQRVDGTDHSPLTSEKDVLLIRSKNPPLVVTHVSEILPSPRSPQDSTMDNMTMIGGSVYFTKLSHKPIKDSVPKLWSEFAWLRSVLEEGGSHPIDWLNSISDDNACELILKLYNKDIHDPRNPSRLALLDNSIATIVNERVRAGDSIVKLESIQFYQGGIFHTSEQEFPARIVIRKLESNFPSELDNRIVAMFPPDDRYIGRRQHCRLIAPQAIRIEETTLERETLLIVH
ncbi:HET-domain-containing protein [Daldinia vernicosa]|uniref:HET-domain-containing protein n=1 Tax=Daldinia vernicosa TaxID=114800 RepID=UPI0020073D70|nr:HET-domain-containing protein [Daldinia vernicosa]KAI0844091.1 HET-domain-containing protein [Daldinia vernicosa]